MFKRPTKKVENVIDLSKPEIQDAEMVDDDDWCFLNLKGLNFVYSQKKTKMN